MSCSLVSLPYISKQLAAGSYTLHFLIHQLICIIISSTVLLTFLRLANSTQFSGQFTESAVLRLFTHSSAITPFRLASGSSPYQRHDTNLRLAPFSYYGSLGATPTLVGDTPTLSFTQLLLAGKASPSSYLLPASSYARTTGISIVETLVSGRKFKPLLQLPRVITGNP